MLVNLEAPAVSKSLLPCRAICGLDVLLSCRKNPVNQKWAPKSEVGALTSKKNGVTTSL